MEDLFAFVERPMEIATFFAVGRQQKGDARHAWIPRIAQIDFNAAIPVMAIAFDAEADEFEVALIEMVNEIPVFE